MLPQWNPSRLDDRLPWVVGIVGGRRQGKSTLTHHLIKRSKRFKLLISFMGTTSCSPEMRSLMETRFDQRFIFNSWNEPLMARLLKQQERLKLQGIDRQVCILVDDIVMSSRQEDNLAHLCLRGRHFNISVICAAVSYTTLPKRSRRSLDCLFLFSCPMSSDMEILTREYCSKVRLARYCLNNLPEWTSLVLETLQKKQQLFHYRVELGIASQNAESPSSSPAETSASPETSQHNHMASHLDETSETECGISNPENHELSETE